MKLEEGLDILLFISYSYCYICVCARINTLNLLEEVAPVWRQFPFEGRLKPFKNPKPIFYYF